MRSLLKTIYNVGSVMALVGGIMVIVSLTIELKMCW